MERDEFKINISKYIEYFVEETTPEGDIKFHTSLKGCIFVPEVRWRADKERVSLRLALELAFKNPLAVAQQKKVYIGPQQLEHKQAA